MFTKFSRILFLLLILSLLIAGIGTLPAHAQTAAVSIDAWAGYKGYFKYGQWLPVWVELDNQGGDLEAEIQVRVNMAIFAVPVSLPAGAHKVVPVYVIPSNYAREVKVQLVDQNQQEIASKNVQVFPQVNSTYLAGIVAAERGAISLLSGAKIASWVERPLALVDIPPAELPEQPESLASFDLIVLNDVDTSLLSPSQIKSLQSWISNGGRLVIGGGAGAQRTLAGLGESLSPVSFSSLGEAEADDLNPLAAYASTEPLQFSGKVPVSLVRAEQSEILVGNEGMPLLVEKRLDNGWIDFIALDLSQSPFNGWSGASFFWQTLIAPGAGYPQNMPMDMSVRQMRASNIPYVLSNMPMLNLPSIGSLAILLGIYILLVGPVNYLVLRKVKKLHLAWVTIPALTLVFAGGAFGITLSVRGTNVVINQISIIEPRGGNAADITSYFGLFSPGDKAYQVSLNSDGLASPLAGYNGEWDMWGPGMNPTANTQPAMTYLQTKPILVRGISVAQWSMQNFMLEETWEDFGTIEAKLELKDGRLVGSLTNHTQQTFKDFTIILGSKFARLGDLPAGGSLDVEMDLQQTNPLTFSGMPMSYMLYEKESSNPASLSVEESRLIDLKRSLVQSVMENGTGILMTKSAMTSGVGVSNDVILLGWLEDLPTQVDVKDQLFSRQVTGMYFTTTSYQMAEEDKISIPAGLINGTMTKYPEEGGTCGMPQSTSVYLYRGAAEFEFQLPLDMQAYDVDVLELSIGSDMGEWWTPFPTDLYDWNSDTWVQIKEPKTGINKIRNGDRFVSPEGVVRIRLSSEQASQGGCTYLGLGLEASRIKP